MKFDTKLAIVTAWKELWAKNLRTRKKEKGRWAAATYYLTAADVERQVRAYAWATLNGKSWSDAEYYGQSVRISGNLKGKVRDFLLRNPEITGHNFGRGHISGMRFRPYGEPIGPVELETMAKKERAKDRPPVKHFGKSYSSRALCVTEAAKAKGRRIWGWRQSRAWVTSTAEEVTCPRCLNLMKKLECKEVA